MFMNSRRAYYALNRQGSNAVRRLHRYGSAQRKAPPAQWWGTMVLRTRRSEAGCGL